MLSNEIRNGIKCPNCISELIHSKENHGRHLTCKECNREYFWENNYIDFVEKERIDKLTQRAIETWGNDLHRENNKNSEHLYKLIKRLPAEYKFLSGEVLEIGFGKGGDLMELSKNKQIQSLYGIDIGKNARDVAKEFNDSGKVVIIRANAQTLPFKDEKFNGIYSYGVIHHTKEPRKTLKECSRVLKTKGLLLFYVYSNHKNNLFKRIGILIELPIMHVLFLLPYPLKLLFCIFVAPLAWLIFTVPSKILYILGYKHLSKKLPLNWGTTPFSILPDIKDRFLASINHRYSKKSINKLLKSTGFIIKNYVEDYSGIYIAAQKVI